jgi:hypothetical protein
MGIAGEASRILAGEPRIGAFYELRIENGELRIMISFCA